MYIACCLPSIFLASQAHTDHHVPNDPNHNPNNIPYNDSSLPIHPSYLQR